MPFPGAAFEELKSHHEKIVERAAQTLEDAEKRSPELETSTQAKAVLADSQTVIDSMVSPAEKGFNERHKCVEYLAVATAEKALVAAQSNTVEIELARQACELAEQVSSSFANVFAAAELINITKIEFSGSTSSLVADGPPLIVNNAAGKFFEEIGAKTVELVEDVAEAVVELAEDIGEGVEKAAEANDDAASDVASALDDAASEIGHAADNAVEAIDDAMSDVGSAFDDAGGAVRHAADDVASATGDAVSDVGHAVDDVASDIGNAFKAMRSRI
ncbi:hypothetical protein B0H63DRAFT_533027 [Podospora didyma]|uniref:Uncharacterized protein n=1 Tax=Podospora didyma TaxID=330526 RepID=A0AAE0P7K6_9PEZI|nr:hypothetical protein B0H63DRAFT_533027 [Podospora didyma]